MARQPNADLRMSLIVLAFPSAIMKKMQQSRYLHLLPCSKIDFIIMETFYACDVQVLSLTLNKLNACIMTCLLDFLTIRIVYVS